MSELLRCPICNAPFDVHLMAGSPCILIGDDPLPAGAQEARGGGMSGDHTSPMTMGPETFFDERDAEIARLREALEEIARQRLPFEMHPDEIGDLEAGYEGCIGRARASLKGEEGK